MSQQYSSLRQFIWKVNYQPNKQIQDVGKSYFTTIITKICLIDLGGSIENGLIEQVKKQIVKQIGPKININILNYRLGIVFIHNQFAQFYQYQKLIKRIIKKKPYLNISSQTVQSSGLSNNSYMKKQQINEIGEIIKFQSQFQQFGNLDISKINFVQNQLQPEENQNQDQNSQVKKYLQNVSSYNAQLTLLASKMKLLMKWGDAEEEKKVFRIQVTVWFQQTSQTDKGQFKSKGIGSNTKLARQQAAKIILENIYSTYPLFWKSFLDQKKKIKT